jgi:DNA-binding CsgD family transcriptional regulator
MRWAAWRVLSEPIAHGFRLALLVTAAGAIDTRPTAQASLSLMGKVIPSRSRRAPSIGSGRWSKSRRRLSLRIEDHPSGRREGPQPRPRSGSPGGRRAVPRTDQVRLVAAVVRHPVGERGGRRRTAIIIQPATPAAVAPRVTLSYGLSERESQVTRLCMDGLSTRQMANALALSPHTVQDHLKSIFAKTGVRSRSELVGQIFLEHYVPRLEDIPDIPTGWIAMASQIPAGVDPGSSPAAMLA